MYRIVSLTTAFVLAALLMPLTSSAATEASLVDLEKVRAQREVRDVILERPPMNLRKSPPAARAAFADEKGNNISIDTTVPGADLQSVANVLNSTYHDTEIKELRVHVITMAEIEATWGLPRL